jgi:hypothetical protein
VSSHIYALAWMPSAAGAIVYAAFSSTGEHADSALAACCAALTALTHVSTASVFARDIMPLPVIS